MEYKGINNEWAFINWLCRKEGILLGDNAITPLENNKLDSDKANESQGRLSSKHTEECSGCSLCEN